MALKSYRDLGVWQKSVDLVVLVYQLTKSFPSDEKFGVASQIKKAAASIPANIAEGYGRTHRGDYLHHLSMARGSLAELETHMVIAGRLNFIERKETVETWGLTQEVGKMLTKLIQSLRTHPKP
ncbi:MAG: four helix bundle protein [Planctomycetia bacterium]|nr:four helix bundle protein [Planctomycetia bacterium]